MAAVRAVRNVAGAAACVAGFTVCVVSCGASDKGTPSLPSEPDAPDAAIHVPADALTLQAAIDLARTGDVILVAPGVYRGEGNRDLRFSSRAITLRSAAGAAETVIDCEGSAEEPHAGFVFDRAGNGTRVEGFTVRNAYAPNGAALHIVSASPTIIDCVFKDNFATDSGGALRCKGGSPRLIGCTFVGNASRSGGAVFLIARARPVFDRCILAFTESGGALFVSDTGSEARLTCSDLFGNEGGDWSEAIEDQLGVDGNISADPLFCSAAEGDFHLREGSPCAPSTNACEERVGALGVACDERAYRVLSSAVEPRNAKKRIR